MSKYALSHLGDDDFVMLRRFVGTLEAVTDWFGTRPEKRFTRAEIERMIFDAGLAELCFLEGSPHRVAVGRKPPAGPALA